MRTSGPVGDAPMEVTVEAVKRLLNESPDDVLLVDCRTDEEVAIACLDGAVHVPMERIASSAEDIAEAAGDRAVVVYCHHGVRSLAAAARLRALGVDGATSMRGGIDWWSVKIDRRVPRY